MDAIVEGESISTIQWADPIGDLITNWMEIQVLAT